MYTLTVFMVLAVPPKTIAKPVIRHDLQHLAKSVRRPLLFRISVPVLDL